MDRLTKLRELEEITRLSIEEAPADRRSALIAQYRGILEEIESIEGADGEVAESNGLISFQAAIAERKPAAKGPRRAAHH